MMMEQVYINGRFVTFEEVKSFFKENGGDLAATAKEFGLEYHKAHYDREGQHKTGWEAEMLFGDTWYSCKKMKKIVYGEYVPTRTYNRQSSEGRVTREPKVKKVKEDAESVYAKVARMRMEAKTLREKADKMDEEADRLEHNQQERDKITAKVDKFISELEESGVKLSESQKASIRASMESAE